MSAVEWLEVGIVMAVVLLAVQAWRVVALRRMWREERAEREAHPLEDARTADEKRKEFDL